MLQINQIQRLENFIQSPQNQMHFCRKIWNKQLKGKSNVE